MIAQRPLGAFCLVCAMFATAVPLQAQRPSPTRSSNANTSQGAAKTMTNADVVKMVQAGLGESVVMGAIKTATQTKFDLDADNLIALKKAGVNDNIVARMLDPNSEPAPPTPTGAVMPGIAGGPVDSRARVEDPHAPVDVPRQPGVYLDHGSADQPNLIALEPTVFSQGKSGGAFLSALTYGIKKMKWKAVVRSKNANLRIRQGTPTFYFYFERQSSGLGNSGGFAGWLSGATSPNEFVLARMDVKRNGRELIVGEFGAFGGSSGTRSKDTVEFMVERLSGGIYQVRPLEPLPPGEYAFFYAAGASMLGAGNTGKLFDFGVDAATSIKD